MPELWRRLRNASRLSPRRLALRQSLLSRFPRVPDLATLGQMTPSQRRPPRGSRQQTLASPLPLSLTNSITSGFSTPQVPLAVNVVSLRARSRGLPGLGSLTLPGVALRLWARGTRGRVSVTIAPPYGSPY